MLREIQKRLTDLYLGLLMWDFIENSEVPRDANGRFLTNGLRFPEEYDSQRAYAVFKQLREAARERGA